MTDSKKLFSAKEVALIFGVSIQTISRLVAEGLVEPRREAGKKRLFTESDLDRIRMALVLSRELGVNWAGVDVIMHMRERMVNLQRQVNEIFDYIYRQTKEELSIRKAPPKSHELPQIKVIKIVDMDKEE